MIIAILIFMLVCTILNQVAFGEYSDNPSLIDSILQDAEISTKDASLIVQNRPRRFIKGKVPGIFAGYAIITETQVFRVTWWSKSSKKIDHWYQLQIINKAD